MNAKNAAEFTKEYISKTHHFPSRQDVWDAATEAAKKRFTTYNSDYEKCSHVIGLICGTIGIEAGKCDELKLHEIYHKIVEIKNVVKELSQHFA